MYKWNISPTSSVSIQELENFRLMFDGFHRWTYTRRLSEFVGRDRGWDRYWRSRVGRLLWISCAAADGRGAGGGRGILGDADSLFYDNCLARFFVLSYENASEFPFGDLFGVY
jgi:hypothetical protein